MCVVLAAVACAFLPGPPTVPGSATRLLARVRPLRALDEVDPLELELERQSEVVEVLRRVSDPALSDLESAKSDDIVSLGLLRDLQTGEDSVRLEFVVPQDAATSGAVDRLRVKCEALLQAELPWVRAVQVDARVVSDSAPTQLSPDGTLGAAGGEEKAPGVAAVRHIVAVASCKGGVGKSTTAVNLAYALHAAGAKVGLVDLDVCGPSLPTMVTPDAPLQRSEDDQLLPLTAHGVKLMSMGFLNPGMMVLRGVKITPVVQQLVGRTEWGELDYLVADMPPGTSDVQLTLSLSLRLSLSLSLTLTLTLTLPLTPPRTLTLTRSSTTRARAGAYAHSPPSARATSSWSTSVRGSLLEP